MISYKYNFWVDLKWTIRTIKKYHWYKFNDVFVFSPNPIKMLMLLLKIKRPDKPIIGVKDDIVCYWVSSGARGSYNLPNVIRIYPWYISKQGMKNVIIHELTHLKYESYVKNMSHQEKEDFIHCKQNELKKEINNNQHISLH